MSKVKRPKPSYYIFLDHIDPSKCLLEGCLEMCRQEVRLTVPKKG